MTKGKADNVIAEAQPRAEAQVWAELQLVLQVPSGLLGAVVAVGVALQKCRCDEAVGGVRGNQSLEELGKVCKTNHARIGSFVPGIELGIRVAAPKYDRVSSVIPNDIDRGHPAILKYSRKGTL